MSSWIAKPWIEQALMSKNGKNLPKIARAQIIKIEQTSHNTFAFISDKKFFVKAVFSRAAVEHFKRDNPTLSMPDIQGGLIFIMKYSLQASCRTEKDLNTAEFVVEINLFKFAGGEGNTQFGSDILDSSTYPPLQPRLHELCGLSQARTVLHGDRYDAMETEGVNNNQSFKEIETSLLENHEGVFIPEDMEKKLAEIPEWQPNYCLPLSCNMQSEITSFGNTSSSNRGQAQASASSMAVECEQSLRVEGKLIVSESLSSSERRDFSQSQTTSKDKSLVKKSTVKEKICTESQGTSHRTRVSLQKSPTGQPESSSLLNEIKDVLPRISSAKKQKQRQETRIRVDNTAACMNSCRESVLTNTVTSSSIPTRGEQLMARSSQRVAKPRTKQTGVKSLEKKELLDVCTSYDVKNKAESGRGLEMVHKSIHSSRRYLTRNYVQELSSQAEVLQGLGELHFLEYQAKGKGNDFARKQEEISVAVISSDFVSSSQKSEKGTQPLRGVVAESQCSSSSEGSNPKASSEESYSVLKERSPPSPVKKSPDICVVPSSENSEEYEQALPNILPGHTAKHFYCSLTESQLENLLESSISYDVESAPPCTGNEIRESQEGYTQIKQRPLTQKESTSCSNQLGTLEASPDSSQLSNISVSELGIASEKDLTTIHKMTSRALREKHTHKDKGLEVHKDVSNSYIVQNNINQTSNNPMTMDFDALFSQNTWNFSEITDRQLSTNVTETDRNQLMKRKRLELEDRPPSTCTSAKARQKNEVLVGGSPVIPDSRSDSVKCGSHSGSSQNQPVPGSKIERKTDRGNWGENRVEAVKRREVEPPSIYLTKPMDLYSQQDPLVLNSSTESLENIDGIIDNDSDLLISRSGTSGLRANTSPSVLERSMEEPSTLMTPKFDSLPSFQVPADNRETPPSRVQKHEDVHSATRHQDAETRQDPGTNKKKRKPRRRKFSWFSDAY